MTGRGGRRAGAGRKTTLARQLKRALIESKADEAEFALLYIANVVRDDNEPTATRLAAARELLDRVWGKPAQAIIAVDWRAQAAASGVNPSVLFERLVQTAVEQLELSSRDESNVIDVDSVYDSNST